MNISVEYALMWMLIILFSVAAACLILATVYDIIYIPRWRRLRGRRLRKRPHVTVLIYIDNDEKGLDQSLSSIKKNRYSNYDVVVVDNNSTKNVRSRTRALLRQHADMPLRYYANRRHTSAKRALNEGFRRSERGDIVFLLASSHVLLPKTLKHLVMFFTTRPSVDALRFPTTYGGVLTVESAVHQLTLASTHLFHKARSVMTVREKFDFTPAQAVRRSIFLNSSMASSSYVAGLPLVELRLRPATRPGIATGFGAFARVMLLFTLVASAGLAIPSDIDQPFLLIWAFVSLWTLVALLLYEYIAVATKGYLLASVFLSPLLFTATTIIYMMRLFIGIISSIFRIRVQN